MVARRINVNIDGAEFEGEVHTVPARPSAYVTGGPLGRDRNTRDAHLPRGEAVKIGQWLTSPSPNPQGDVAVIEADGFTITFRASHNNAVMVEVKDK